MLIITRRKYESVVINDNITLTVVEIRGDKIRLGITCPAKVPVYRQEFVDAIQGSPPPPRSAEEKPFLQAVLEEPNDERIRLVFADWLEERGDPLAEFVRNQCFLANLAADDQRCWEVESRQRALWAEHGVAWKASLPLAVLCFA